MEKGPADNSWPPKKWMNNDENPGASLDAYFEDMNKRGAEFEALGVPWPRPLGGNFRDGPKVEDITSLPPGCPDVLEIQMVRQIPPGHPGKAATYKTVGRSLVGIEMVAVSKSEVATLEKQGWTVKHPPRPPLESAIDNRYSRTVDPPNDVISPNKPARDKAYLERGRNFANSTMTNKGWRHGQLMGPNGSDPATIAQSPSYLPLDRHDDLSEPRSATSTGHIPIRNRPNGVCAGWGGYDKHIPWQSYGRRVTKDMVEKEECLSNIHAPVRFVDSSGSTVATVTMPFNPEDLPSQPQKPVPLYDALNSDVKQNWKA